MRSKHSVCARRFSLVGAVGVFGVLIGSVALFGGTGGYATGAIDEINITIPSSCSLTNTIGSAHTATIETGVFQENIGETTFKVFCNDSEGFSVYTVGYTNDEFGNNTLKPAVVDNSNAVATGTATSGSASNWAMKLSAVSGTYAPTLETGFNDYHIIPDVYTKVASYSSNTDVTNGSSFKSTYSAFISQTQLADSYTGKVKYTVVHPSSELAPIEEIGQLTYMQDFKDLTAEQRTAVLNSMQYNTIYNLIDNRDNKTYQIARLKDDNIWMVDNLDLGRTELTTDLTSLNTNLSETISASTYNGWKVTSATGSYDTGVFLPLTTSNTTNGLDTDPSSGTAYGTLYNYYAASAGTISGSISDTSAQYDICPAGWRLPTGGSVGEYQAMYSISDYNSLANVTKSISDGGAAFALAGYYDTSGTVANSGTKSAFWASTYNNNKKMDDFWIGPNMLPLDSSDRCYGFAIRCISKKPSRALTISYSTGVSNVKVNGITIQNGGVVNLEEGTPYSVTVTMTEGYALSDWTSTSGSVGSNVSETTIYTIGSDNATLTANAMLSIQNLDSSNCTTTASQVVDNRDNHVYTIQRLADGRCWMMENLDLGRTVLTKDLTSANTNLVATVTASTFNGWKKTASLSTFDAGVFIVLDGADLTSQTSYGSLYNYYALSAGTISGETNSSNAKYDICPARWRLPTGGNSGEYKNLYNSGYNSNEKMRASIAEGGAAFALAGNMNSSSEFPAVGSFGLYWSSTQISNLGMYNIAMDTTTYINMVDNYSRNLGMSVRCILDETSISDLAYMQDFNSLTHAAKASVAKSMADSTVYSLIDNRDSKSYQIARLKDGNIWMAENLDLGRTPLTTDLTSANTNLDANTANVVAETFNTWIKTSGIGSWTEAYLIPVTGTDSISNTPYGTLYNYCAVSAGTICSASDSNNDDATSDLCPAGWRLPTGGSSGEFQALSDLTYYNTSAKMKAPIVDGGAAFARAGYFNSSTPTNQDVHGHYWSSTRYDGSKMYYLYLYTSSTYPNNYGNRLAGYAVRCIANP